MGAGYWIEVVRHRPPPGLDGLVAGAVGISERAGSPVVRRQQAGSLIPLVLSWGPPLDVLSRSAGPGAGRYRSFVAGFTDGHSTTRYVGGQDCVQIYLTPIGVQRLLGLPGSEIARALAPAHDVVPGLDRSVEDQLGSAGSWAQRFAVADALLLRLARSGRPLDPVVTAMWSQIEHSGGQVRIADLVAGTGWSHRHATARFRAQFGLTPKAAAGVVRFEHAAADLGRRPLADVAAAHGYADQSHLTRDVVRYSGDTPGRLRRAPTPTPYTALGRAPAEVVTPSSACLFSTTEQ